MGFTIKQKIDICLYAEAHPKMTQQELAVWAQHQYQKPRPPCQTTISRILSSKNDLIAAKNTDLSLVRRRKRSNPLLRRIMTEWMTQGVWEGHPMPNTVILLVATLIWNRLPQHKKEGTGVFSSKWINSFVERLNINLEGRDAGRPLNKVWALEEKVDLKQHLRTLAHEHNYRMSDIFCIEEFSLFYLLPLDQIFDVLAIDLGLKQTDSPAERLLTIMLGCNMDGLEKLPPLVVGKYENFDVAKHPAFAHDGDLLELQLHKKIGKVFGIQYLSNVNKWITLLMFHKYLLSWELRLRAADRHIMILLDDSLSHRVLNLEFTHIRLVYLKNNLWLKQPAYGAHGNKYDLLPLNQGVIEHFRILYRIQQYQWMINCQRNQTHNQLEVLSEKDYKIPLVNTLQLLRNAWDLVLPEVIQVAWRRTHLFDKHWWQAYGVSGWLAIASTVPDAEAAYSHLQQLITELNVVIPWEIDELIALVNERSKVTLMYTSLEEIIDSCLSETLDYEEFLQMEDLGDDWLKRELTEAETPVAKRFSPAPTFDQYPVTPAPEPAVAAAVSSVLELVDRNVLMLQDSTVADLQKALFANAMP